MLSALLILSAQQATLPTEGLHPDWRRQVEALAGKALGDPRGAAYRRVQLTVDMHYPSGRRRELVESEGWVVSGGKSAVLWDGLVYPISKVLGKADLHRARAESLADRPPSNPLVDPWGTANMNGVCRNQGAAALWYLVGEEAVALRILLNLNRSSSVHQFEDRDLPYWLAERYRARAVTSLNSARDEDALIFAKTELALRGTDMTLSFVGQRNTAPQLIEDLERRLANKSRKLDLLDDFENIQYLPNMSSAVDPIMQRAIDAGPDIVPQLITRSSQDKRLTRAEVPSRNFRDRSIAEVGQAYRYVLEVLWPESAYYTGRSDEELQAVFARHRNLSTAERLVEVIADLTTPDFAAISALGQFSLRSPERTSSAQREIRLAGSRFASKIASGIEVRYRRLVDEFNREPNQNPLARSGQMALALATFDYALGQSLLRESAKLIVDNLDRPMYGGERPRWDLINIFTLAAANGDSEILSAYTTFCGREDVLEDFPSEAMPALKNPKNGQAQNAASQIFRRAEEIVANEGSPGQAIRLLNSLLSRDIGQLIAAQQVRDMLHKGLHNESRVVARGRVDGYELPVDRGEVSLFVAGKHADRQPISVADFVAHVLADKFETGTDFELTAAESKRLLAKTSIDRWLMNLPDKPLPYKERKPAATALNRPRARRS